MSLPRGAQHETHDTADGAAWAQIYISALSSPAGAQKATPQELVIYARAVADRYLDFRRAARRLEHERHASRGSDERPQRPKDFGRDDQG
ncbi:MAG TPA: hypothetical protein VEB22_06955 [Phycisphaerales bacterium]|nr:hypothetical protein [Phycisphaerales bacterium]